MKLTKSELKELIRGQVAATLEEAWKDVEGEYFPPHSEETYAPEETKEEDYYDDSLHRGYDEDIAAIDQAFRNLAFSVIDEYKGHKSFDKNAAGREILDTLQAAVDNFVEGGGGPNVIDLPKILADEFKEEDPDAEWMDDEASLRQQDWPEDLKEAGDLTQDPDIRAWINSTQGQEQIRALMILKSELMAVGLVTDDNHWEALLQDPVDLARVTRLWDQLGKVKTTGSRVAVEQIIKEELEKALNEAEDLDPAIVNGWLLRIVSGDSGSGEDGVRIEDEPPSHMMGRRKHAMWKQKKEEVDQAIVKINNGEYTKGQLDRAKRRAAEYQHPNMDKWKEKARDIKNPLPAPKSKIGRMVSKLKDRFGVEEALK